MEDALTLKGDEGRGVPAISVGEAASSLRSGDDRMGQPHCVNHNDPSPLLVKKNKKHPTSLLLVARSSRAAGVLLYCNKYTRLVHILSISHKMWPKVVREANLGK